MSPAPDLPELIDRLGPDGAQGLLDWAELNDQSVSLLRPSWLPPGKGHTGAVLAALEVAPPPMVAVLKVLPEGRHRTEPARHTRALRAAPGQFAKDHLVEQPFAPFPLEGGGALMFQSVAGDTLRAAVPLGALRGPEFTRTCAHVARGLLTEWNTSTGRPVRTLASAFLRAETDPAGGGLHSFEPHRRHADPEWAADAWFEAAGRRLPNPYLMVTGHPDLPDPEMSVLTGLTHGDLHTDNIIVPLRHGVPLEEAYRLIDLGGFRPDGALTCDIAMLLLSALTPFVTAPLPRQQEEALIGYVVAPRAEYVDLLPPDLTRRVDCVRDTAEEVMGKWREPWTDQLLLSVVACALTFTTFSGLGARARDWYLLLAAHAGAAVLHSRTEGPATVSRPAAPSAHEPPTPQPPIPPDPGPADRLQAPGTPHATPSAIPRQSTGSTGDKDRRRALLEALEAVPAMADKDSREAVLRRLPRRLATSIPRSNILRVELLGLVDTCLAFPGGLGELWEAIATVDTGTREREELLDALRRMPDFRAATDEGTRAG
ncbi:effector-associated domain 2-containing protein [Streptomyces adustus]